MKYKLISFFILVIFHSNLFGQCQFTLDSYSHVNCNSENTGAIYISFIDPNISFWWTGPNGFTSTSKNLSSLFAGDYVLTIVSNLDPGDTSSQLLCSNLDIYGNPKDTITIEETLKLEADFSISGKCNELDSADVFTNLIGGTPPYTTLWSTGDTARNINNLQSNSLLPYSILITDNNGCQTLEYLRIDPISPMQTFSSHVDVICKAVSYTHLTLPTMFEV